MSTHSPEPMGVSGRSLVHRVEAAVFFLYPGNQGVAHEFVDGDLVELETALEGGVGNLYAMERIDIRQLSAGVLQVFEGLHALYHLLDGEGGEEIVVDEVELLGTGTSVALWPFLGVADGPHAAQVDAGGEVGGLTLFDQVGEGEIGSVGMGHMAAHHQRECSYAGGPEYVGVGRCLGSALQGSLMYGPKFVHMVALVGTGPCVHEGEHTCD